MDKIIIKDFEVFANHGVYPEEKALGQLFVISVEIVFSAEEAVLSDDAAKTINYGCVCHDIEQFMKSVSFNLIETAAFRLIKMIFEKYTPAQSVKLTVKKPWAPVAKHLNYVAVEMERAREEMTGLKDKTAYLGLGSNMGDRQKHIMDMVDMLKNTRGVTLNAVSSIYETRPAGYTDQDDFLNSTVEISTTLSPFELLDVCMRIENALERRRTVKWGPRTADMDILFYGELVLESEKLTIPHPLLHERGFVLLPLMDIAPDKIHPARNVSIRDLCKSADCSGIALYAGQPAPNVRSAVSRECGMPSSG